MTTRDRLIKLAGIQDYLLRRDMTPEDQARMQILLDQQGLPRHPEQAHSHMDMPEPVKDSMGMRALRHVKEHKVGYGLGAAGLLGASLLYKRMNRSEQQVDPTLLADQQQAGF